MSNSTLTITPKAATESEPSAFHLAGNIDAHAADALKSLYNIPAGPARLDFSAVQRVNSMGLALLLKLFEHCENQGVTIQVAQANRMTSMLFKMTNLERYLADVPKKAESSVGMRTAKAVGDRGASAMPAAPPIAKPQPQSPSPARPTLVRPAQLQEKPAVKVTSAQPVEVGGKLKFLANMQNSQQLNGWYFFNTYLQRRLSREIHLDLIHAAWDNELQPSATHLVFAQPFQATRLLLQHDFNLVARPNDQADEITVLVRADDPRQSVAEFASCKVVTDTAESFVYLLGRFLLDESGLESENLSYAFTGHEIKAVRAVLTNEADILFMQSENFKSLSALTRGRLRALDSTDSGIAFHMFCLSPACADLLPAFRSTLLDMSGDDKGRQVLTDLGLTGWSEPEPEEINMLTMLYQRYVTQ